jgi:hypothetical protein
MKLCVVLCFIKSTAIHRNVTGCLCVIKLFSLKLPRREETNYLTLCITDCLQRFQGVIFNQRPGLPDGLLSNQKSQFG